MRDLHRRPDDDQELLAFAEYTVKSAVVAYAAGLTRLYGALITESIRSAHEALLLELKGGPGSGPPLGNQNARKNPVNEEDVARWTKRVADLEADKSRKGRDWTDRDEENLQAAKRILAQMEGKPAKPARGGQPPPPAPLPGARLPPKEFEDRKTNVAGLVRDMMNTIPEAKATFLGLETGGKRKPTDEEIREWRLYVQSVIKAWLRGELLNGIVKPKWLPHGEGSRMLGKQFGYLRGYQEGLSEAEEKEVNDLMLQTAARERRGEEVPRNPLPRPHTMGPFPLGGPLKR